MPLPDPRRGQQQRLIGPGFLDTELAKMTVTKEAGQPTEHPQLTLSFPRWQ